MRAMLALVAACASHPPPAAPSPAAMPAIAPSRPPAPIVPRVSIQCTSDVKFCKLFPVPLATVHVDRDATGPQIVAVELDVPKGIDLDGSDALFAPDAFRCKVNKVNEVDEAACTVTPTTVEHGATHVRLSTALRAESTPASITMQLRYAYCNEFRCSALNRASVVVTLAE